MNPKKLYASSAVTAREILKITALLTTTHEQNGKDVEETKSLQDVDLSDKVMTAPSFAILPLTGLTMHPRMRCTQSLGCSVRSVSVQLLRFFSHPD